MNRLRLTSIFLILNIIVIVIFSISSIFLIRVILKNINFSKKQQEGYRSIPYIFELKNGSERLSNLAVNYIMTHNSEFEIQYGEILEIRNGKRPQANGKTIPLMKILEKFNLPNEELIKLRVAEDISNHLSSIDKKAMNAAKGMFEDSYGNFTINREPDSIMAYSLLFSEEYIKGKNQIENNIQEYFDLQLGRIRLEFEAFHKDAIRSIILFSILFLTALFSVFLNHSFFRKQIIKRIIAINQWFTSFINGKTEAPFPNKLHDEIGELVIGMNDMVENMKEKTNFIKEIGKGNLDKELITKGEKDQFAVALLEMRKSLQDAKEEQEHRKIEDEQRNWAAHGLALFGDILRQDNDNIKILCEKLIMNLVDYLKANQGGIFILEDSNPAEKYLDLIASYAFNRKKYLQKKILLGEGLTGVCALEKETIYMTALPDDYIEITSGLGSSKPKSLLIAPMKYENNIVGVIEIASFEELMPHEREFIEKLTEDIASTISIVKINANTNKLLKEMQFQTEQMAAQEEEMRQNMEELQATQEEMARKSDGQKREIEKLNSINEKRIQEIQRKELEVEGILNALNNSTYLIEYDLKGYIQYVNDYVSNLFKIHKDTFIGKRMEDIILREDEQNKEIRLYMDQVDSNKSLEMISNIEIDNKMVWLSETFSVILDQTGNPHKILEVAYDITQEKIREQELYENMKKEEEVKESHQRTINKIIKGADKKESKLKKMISERDQMIRDLQNKIKE